jgi:small-conductance mechanosensitive channel
MRSDGALELFGVHLVGATPENGRKLLLTVALIAIVILLTWLLRFALRTASKESRDARFRFWGRQIVSLLGAAFLVLGTVSIWFNDPSRLAGALGLATAGIAFALQRVITATAGYFVILRGKTFNVGDRIVMGGVRGDVVALTFMQTKIMEMGQPPPVQSDEPAMWVHSRQFTGRIVTVSNEKIFDEPVYNYSFHFPYIWEEIRLPVAYRDDRHKAEDVLLAAARNHALRRDRFTEDQLADLERRYQLSLDDIEPRVYWRITDNWLELTVRFLGPDHGIRAIKDAMSREIMAALDKAGIGIASSTMEVTTFPAPEVKRGTG